MTQNTESIPLMDDFTESSLLDQIKVEEEETPEEIEARELKEREEAEALEVEKEEAEKLRLAKEQEDGLTEEEKEAKIIADKKTAEDQGSFWEDVEAITGNTYEVDYGDVDPDSVEGAALREKVVTDTAIAENLDYIRDTYPEAYKVLEHVSNGGKLTDLVNAETTSDYASIQLSEEDIIQQKAVLKDYYLGMGLSEVKATRNVEDDEDSEEGLFKNAQAALEVQKKAETDKQSAILANQAKAKEAQDARDKQFSQSLSSIINGGKVGNFKVPKADSENFYNHVLQHVKREGDGYALTIPLSNDNFQEQLQQMFFGFKKGDLSKFVVAEGKTVAARKLKRNLTREKGAEEGSSEEKARIQGKKLPSMGAFEI